MAGPIAHGPAPDGVLALGGHRIDAVVAGLHRVGAQILPAQHRLRPAPPFPTISGKWLPGAETSRGPGLLLVDHAIEPAGRGCAAVGGHEVQPPVIAPRRAGPSRGTVRPEGGIEEGLHDAERRRVGRLDHRTHHGVPVLGGHEQAVQERLVRLVGAVGAAGVVAIGHAAGAVFRRLVLGQAEDGLVDDVIAVDVPRLAP